MKKILIASTALIATAGVAAADVTFDGYGRFGLTHNDGDTNLHQRFRLNITAATETNGGVEVYGTVRLQADSNDDDSAYGRPLSAGVFGLTYGGFNAEFGNASDVIDAENVVNFFGYGAGLTYILETDAAFGLHDANGLSNDEESQQRITATYSNAGLTVAATFAPEAGAEEYWQVGAGYRFGDYNVGAVYGDNEFTGDYWLVGFDGAAGDFAFQAVVGDHDLYDDLAWGASAQYTLSSATSIQALVAGGGTADNTAYGVGFIHSLGGGVSLRGGVANNADDNTEADFGVRFDF